MHKAIWYFCSWSDDEPEQFYQLCAGSSTERGRESAIGNCNNAGAARRSSSVAAGRRASICSEWPGTDCIAADAIAGEPPQSSIRTTHRHSQTDERTLISAD